MAKSFKFADNATDVVVLLPDRGELNLNEYSTAVKYILDRSAKTVNLETDGWLPWKNLTN